MNHLLISKKFERFSEDERKVLVLNKFLYLIIIQINFELQKIPKLEPMSPKMGLDYPYNPNFLVPKVEAITPEKVFLKYF